MERIANWQFAELISATFDCIPKSIAHKLDYVHFLTGADPIFAGLHSYEFSEDERSFRNISHVVFPYHQRLPQNLQRTTIVLPYLESIEIVTHELGHVLDEVLGFEHIANPVTEYAKINRMEAFAEAFTSWLFWDYGEEPDEVTRVLFEQLAGVNFP